MYFGGEKIGKYLFIKHSSQTSLFSQRTIWLILCSVLLSNVSVVTLKKVLLVCSKNYSKNIIEVYYLRQYKVPRILRMSAIKTVVFMTVMRKVIILLMINAIHFCQYGNKDLIL